MKPPIALILRPFGLGVIQDAILMFQRLRDAGYSVEDLSAYASTTIQSHKDLKRTVEMEHEARVAYWVSKGPRCPECGKRMGIIEVNTKNCNRVPGDAKSIWVCSDEWECGHSIENEFTPAEVLYKLNVPQPVNIPMGTGAPDMARSFDRRRARAISHVSRQAAAPVAKKPCGGCR